MRPHILDCEGNIVILIISLLFIEDVAGGQMCYDCKNIPEPHDCEHITKCLDGEQCYADYYLTPQGHVFYDLGCQPDRVCNVLGRKRSTSRRQDGNLHLCEECCNTSECNRHSCADNSNYQNRTICYDCPDVVKVTDCDKVTICKEGHICIAKKQITELWEERWSVGCETKRQCDASKQASSYGHPVQTPVIGKRDKQRTLRQSSLFPFIECLYCCKDNYCNHRECQKGAATATTAAATKASTTIAKTTTAIKRTTTQMNPTTTAKHINHVHHTSPQPTITTSVHHTTTAKHINHVHHTSPQPTITTSVHHTTTAKHINHVHHTSTKPTTKPTTTTRSVHHNPATKPTTKSTHRSTKTTTKHIKTTTKSTTSATRHAKVTTKHTSRQTTTKHTKATTRPTTKPPTTAPSGLTCNYCTYVNHEIMCNHTTVCNPGEQCYLARVDGDDLNDYHCFYSLGCMSKSDCNSYKHDIAMHGTAATLSGENYEYLECCENRNSCNEHTIVKKPAHCTPATEPPPAPVG